MVALIALAVFVYLANGAVTTPAKKKLARMKEEKVAAQARIDGIGAKMRELGNSVTGVSSNRADTTKKVIPQKDELMPALLDKLASLGRDNDIEVSSISPEPFTAVSVPGVGNGTHGQYEKIGVAMRMRCRYKNLGEYLRGLESLDIPVSVTNLSISSNEKELPTLDASLLITTYARD
ncbi:MAG: type 4a pilus biogenesis protein PilO [Candidatus Eisenbacteria bacterium]|nr:type 4a pilus biogenesis protein PilO [Candidatus Eisenbacteria bacterium]